MVNETSRTARKEPNCLHSPSASIMTGFDIPAGSSAMIQVTFMPHEKKATTRAPEITPGHDWAINAGFPGA